MCCPTNENINHILNTYIPLILSLVSFHLHSPLVITCGHISMQQAVLVVFSLSALLSSVSLYHQVPSYMIHGCGIYDMTIFFKYLPFLPNSTTSLLTSARQGNGCYDRYCLLASYQPGLKCSQTGRTAVHSATAIEKLHVRVCEAKGCLSVSGHSSQLFPRGFWRVKIRSCRVLHSGGLELLPPGP